MLPQTQSLATHFPACVYIKSGSTGSSLSPLKSLSRTQFRQSKAGPCRGLSFQPLKCSLSVVSEPPQSQLTGNFKPYPAEVSRTIMELSSSGTLSVLDQKDWPLGFGVRFAVDPEGRPALCLNDSLKRFSHDMRSTLHVQLEQCRLRTPQCTIQGYIEKPQDIIILKKLQSVWKKRFQEDVDENHIYFVSVERVLQMEDFAEDGTWVTSSDYKLANPDPLRDFAEKFVDEINEHNSEDVYRFCNIYADLDFQVLDAKLVWVDRLGFDVRVRSPQQGLFEVRIPFPREVTDEKGAKSSFNGMSQLAWEVEKNFHVPQFNKVKQLKKISSGV